MDSFVTINKIIHRQQYGFLRNSSTLSATVEVLNYMHTHLDSTPQNIIGAMFIDLKKAFDTVPHALLLNKLERYGMRGHILSLIRNYLSARTQYIRLDDTESVRHEVGTGVPQGSNLGPLLFLLYVNDIFQLQLRGKIILYADDTIVLYTAQNVADLEEMMQGDLDMIHNWLNYNKLTLNCEKTKYMILTSANTGNRPLNITLKIGNTFIKGTDTFKYLGLTIQQNLRWETHTNDVCKKIGAITGAIGRIGCGVCPKVLIALYHAHVNSHFTYLLSVWGPSLTEAQLNCLQVCQNIAIRRVFRRDYTLGQLSTMQIRKRYNFLDIRGLLKLESACLHYKVYHACLRTEHQFEVSADTHDYNTRNRDRIIVPAYRTNMGKNNPIRAGIVAFNAMPTEVRHSINSNSFRKNAKRYLINVQ